MTEVPLVPATEFRLGGEDYQLSLDDVLAAASRSTPEPLMEHWVEVVGRRWPPKQLLELATGIRRAEFISHMAIRIFRRLGLATSAMPSERGRAVSPTDVRAGDRVHDGDALVDLATVGHAFAMLVKFLTEESLTARIDGLERELVDADFNRAGALAAEGVLTPELLDAALLVRRHAGRVNDFIHASVILQALPKILLPGERVVRRPSLASGNDPERKFDLETTYRIAEFKVSIWKGADTMRQRTLVADLVGLVLDVSDRRAQLYVVGERPIHYLRNSSSTVQWALGRSSPARRAAFEARFGKEPVVIRDFMSSVADRVELKNLCELVPALSDLVAS
ncbi:hypothetical protein [Amycolatopsis sp. NPDC059657]|uniref:hypothetical protein n=1 Tax=Amycolatopsis sp. NPDC059657 TaxID=3346899 RepID=UPI003672771E